MNGINLLFDTNILINHLQDNDPQVFSLIEENNVAISIISKIEVLGYHGISTKEEKKLRYFLETVQIINVNDDIADLAIALRRKYKLKTPDSLIGATSMFLNVPLVTEDSDFKKIEEVELVTYLR